MAGDAQMAALEALRGRARMARGSMPEDERAQLLIQIGMREPPEGGYQTDPDAEVYNDWGPDGTYQTDPDAEVYNDWGDDGTYQTDPDREVYNAPGGPAVNDPRRMKMRR